MVHPAIPPNAEARGKATTMQITTLRPGLLVSLSTSIRGNVKYRSQDIERDHLDPDGARRARWETERTVIDPNEHDAAVKVRSKCRSLITAVCSDTNHGPLCPLDREPDLIAAVEQAQALAADFNRRATVTRIGVYVITGKVAADDVQAVRAINADVRQLLEDMEDGLQRLDVEKVRAAAKRAKSMGQMLSTEAQAKIQIAIDAARATAKRMVKAGEEAAAEIDRATLRTIREARTGFLDLDEQGEIAEPDAAARAIDLEPAERVEQVERSYVGDAPPAAVAEAPAAIAPVRQARLFDFD